MEVDGGVDEETKKKRPTDLSTTGDDASDSVPPKNEGLEDDDEGSKRWPESEGNRFQKIFKSWTYSYMRPVMQKGRRQFKDGHHLTEADLYHVPDEMKAKELVETFRYVRSSELIIWK
jgi:hypothetical protein